jgi:hypothetical protein
VNLDGWTCDFLAARREGFQEGFNSRMGVGPIETIGNLGPETGLRQMIATTAVHFDQGFTLNKFAWVTNCWEQCLVSQIGHLESLTAWLKEIRKRWPDARCLTLGEFGELWRKQFRNNEAVNYRFVQQGTGIGGSDEDKEIRWYMNKEFRLAILRDLTANAERVIDFTRYDVAAQEPADMTRRWSLMGVLNQKRTRPQDSPLPFNELTQLDRQSIVRRYPEFSQE